MTLNYAFFCVGENLHTELYLHIPKIHNAPIFVGVFVYLFTLFIHTSILPKIHTREALSALLHHLHFSLPSHLPHTILTCNQNGASSLSHVRRVTRGDPYMCVCVFRSGSRTDVPKRGAWSSWARWAPGGTRFSGARGGWGRWWTGWSPGSWSPTGPSPTTEVCVQFS